MCNGKIKLSHIFNFMFWVGRLEIKTNDLEMTLNVLVITFTTMFVAVVGCFQLRKALRMWFIFREN